jgi:hypothetical protein
MATSSLLFALAIAAGSVGQPRTIPAGQVDEQNNIFQRWWGTKLVWKFDELPTSGQVPDYRVPYSGYYYPDVGGGTMRMLRKYDIAFNAGRLRATGHEQWDTTAYKEETMKPERVGLFRLRTRMVPSIETPHWYGHCNGWTAATIGHAEPQKTVVRNGVSFTPADIKGLLAEIYMYSHYESLAGADQLVDAGMLHVILANWLGRQSHPIAMDADPGRERWNFPIYSYTSSVTRRSERQVVVQTNIDYAYYSNGEYERSPRIARRKFFQYELDLNEQGEIVGGVYYRGSSIIDLLWVPLRPVQGGKEGNERGNPYVDVNEVVSIWRDSVPEDILAKWQNIDSGQEPAPQVASAPSAGAPADTASSAKPAPSEGNATPAATTPSPANDENAPSPSPENRN